MTDDTEIILPIVDIDAENRALEKKIDDQLAEDEKVDMITRLKKEADVAKAKGKKQGIRTLEMITKAIKGDSEINKQREQEE